MVNSNGERMGKLKKFSLRLLTSILIFAALDFIAGMVMVGDNLQSFRTKHFYYHHGLLPNRSALAAWGSLVYPFHTNSLGMTDSAVYDVPLESDHYRLLILGDSHSEGVGVPYQKTFAGRLASDFRSDGIQVLNASCISYSQKIEYLKAKYLIEEEGLDIDHIFVLVDISDMQNELVYDKFEPKPQSFFRTAWISVRSFLKRHSAVVHLTSSYLSGRETESFFEQAKVFDSAGEGTTETNSFQLYSTFFSHFDDNTLLSNPQFHGVGEWYYDDFFMELADRGIEMGQHYMGRLKELCDTHGIELTISVHPWHSQVIKGDPSDYYTERWETFCSEEEIGFVNLFPLFINEKNALLVNRMYYIQDDNHWNEFGHALVYRHLSGYFNQFKTGDQSL